MAVIKKFKAVKISQNHLLGIQDISVSEVSYILDEAKAFIKLNKSTSKKTDILRGKTQINLFFEFLYSAEKDCAISDSIII